MASRGQGPRVAPSVALLSILLSAALVAAWGTVCALAAADPVARTEWAHLDCSACLAVSAVLGTRMNASLKQAPGSYKVSHRLDRESSERRVAYKTGELRGVEILDDMCRDAFFKEYFLRLNPKTKVRGYHLVDHGTCKAGQRRVLLEDAMYPDRASIGRWFWGKLDGIKLPVAHYYSKGERERMGSSGFLKAPQVACANFLDEHDDELMEIIREADWLSEVEEQLCGLQWGHVVPVTRRQIRKLQEKESRLPREDDATDADGYTAEDDAKLWKGLSSPVSSVCRDAEAISSAAAMDQRRWFAWSSKRKQRRAAEREARRGQQKSPSGSGGGRQAFAGKQPSRSDGDDGGDL